MTVPTSYPARDMGAMLRALLDEGYTVTLRQDRLGACFADLAGPLGSQSTGLGSTPGAALASVWPLHGDLAPLGDDPDGDQAEEPGAVEATAAAVLAAKITALREYVARTSATGGADQAAAALERVSADLSRISVILAAATEGDDEDQDDAEPYCAQCGHWASLFHGLDGWQHFRGDPAPGGKRELYDADHDADPAWIVPPGRPLAPADMTVIRGALADAYASQWHRDDPAATGRAAAYVALLGRIAAGAEGREGSK